MPTVVLVRHGESTWNHAGRVQGWAATTLTERGRAQSRALAAHLAERYDPVVLTSSDLQRAQETVRPVARAVGVEATFDPAWRERDFGALQGLTVAELFGRYPQHSLRDAGYTAFTEVPPGGESLVDTRERVLDAWERLLADLAPEDAAVVVTHGSPISLLVGHLTGQDGPAAVLERHQDNAALTELDIPVDDEPGGGRRGDDDNGDGRRGDDEPGDVRVVRENESGFLDEGNDPA